MDKMRNAHRKVNLLEKVWPKLLSCIPIAKRPDLVQLLNREIGLDPMFGNVRIRSGCNIGLGWDLGFKLKPNEPVC